MSNNTTTVSVQILGKDFQVSCAPDEERDLQKAASLLNDKMAAIRQGGNVIGIERIAVMAALNIANEFILQGETLESKQETKMQGLCDKIDQVLIKHSQIEI